MTESIKRDEAIRLNNGRIYTLDAAKIGTNEYEVMLFNPRTGEEIDSAKTSTEADAILQFDRLRRMYHRPAPAADAPVVLKGRYKKLAEDLAAALVYGLEPGQLSLGGVYPPGLAVGTVRSLITEEDGLTRYAQVEPAADIGGVQYVYVIVDYGE